MGGGGQAFSLPLSHLHKQTGIVTTITEEPPAQRTHLTSDQTEAQGHSQSMAEPGSPARLQTASAARSGWRRWGLWVRRQPWRFGQPSLSKPPFWLHVLVLEVDVDPLSLKAQWAGLEVGKAAEGSPSPAQAAASQRSWLQRPGENLHLPPLGQGSQWGRSSGGGQGQCSLGGGAGGAPGDPSSATATRAGLFPTSFPLLLTGIPFLLTWFPISCSPFFPLSL